VEEENVVFVSVSGVFDASCGRNIRKSRIRSTRIKKIKMAV
jgi:hypothetical protein